MMDSSTLGSTHAEPPRLIQSLRAIQRLRPVKGSEWSVIAFALNKDMIDENGKLDPYHGVITSLGSFPTEEEADQHARSIIEITGHKAILVIPYGDFADLTTEFDPEHVVDVKVDPSGKLIKLERQQYNEDKELFERRAKIEADIEREAQEETDPDSVEHFKRQAYLVLKNSAKRDYLQKQLDEATANYEKRLRLLRDHYQRHPEHEGLWLPLLKDRLAERGESALYEGLFSSYQEKREEILGLAEEECPDGICLVDDASSEDIPDPTPVQQPQTVQQPQQPSPVQTLQPVQQPQPVQTPQQVQPVQPVQSLQPIQQPQQVQTPQPVQQPQPVQSIQQPVQPFQQPQPVIPVKQPQPVQQPSPIQQLQPVTPIMPQPVQQPQPVIPVQQQTPLVPVSVSPLQHPQVQ